MKDNIVDVCVDGKVIATVKESQLKITKNDFQIGDGFVRPKGTGWENINGVWKNTIEGFFLIVDNPDMEFKVTLAMSDGKAYVDKALYRDFHNMDEWEEVPERFNTMFFMEWSGPYFKELKEKIS